MARVNPEIYEWIKNGGEVDKVALCDFLINVLIYYEVDYIEGSGYKEQYDYRGEMDRSEIAYNEDEFAKKYSTAYSMTQDDWWIRARLSYGDAGLTWEINDGRRRRYKDKGLAEFFQGFPVLAELIPEYGDYEIYEGTEE